MGAENAPVSLKALGKRPISQVEPELDLAAVPPPQPQPLAAVQKREKRLTRSSFGGSTAGVISGDQLQADDRHSSDSSPSARLHLPLKTSILLTTRLLPRLVHYPPSTSSSSSPTPASSASPNPDVSATPTATSVPEQSQKLANKTQQQAKPLYRLMDETEFLPSRNSRHAALAEIDTSDALYHRLHRYPEVLEKRASRVERERLIHERSKLIIELEELRGRGWVYTGSSSGTGGKAEEERQRKVKEGELRLARYDALLPNQPRKSNFLNLSSTANGPTNASTSSFTGLPNIATTSNRSSPAPVPAPPPPQIAASNANRRSTGSTLIGVVIGAPSTSSGLRAGKSTYTKTATPPLSATSTGGNGSTKIRIKFNPSSTSTTAVPPTGTKSQRRATSFQSSRQKGSAVTSTRPSRTSARRESKVVSYAEDDDDDDDRSDQDGDVEHASYAREGPASYGYDHDTNRTTASESSLSDLDEANKKPRSLSKTTVSSKSTVPSVRARRSSGINPSSGLVHPGTSNPDPTRTITKPKRPTRVRLRDSFFHTTSMRDSFFPKLVVTPNNASTSHAANKTERRRSSNRIVYAFGHRLPESTLLLEREFEPFGGEYHSTTSYATGSSDDDDSSSSDEDEKKVIDDTDGTRVRKGYSRRSVEDLIRDRLTQRGEQGEFVVLKGGKILPRSAVDAWSIDPVRQETNTNQLRAQVDQSLEPPELDVKQEQHDSDPRMEVDDEAQILRTRPASPVRIAHTSKPRTLVPNVPTGPPVPVRAVSKPASSGTGTGGGGLAFALPSVTQVLFASVPTSKESSPI
ncbi:uncharacterized protein JCM15063_000527 [Sporobolomyces koalae]|uniref:uncharacterized protein n=1 Tax=Sporobolomyces koalae TaxID=500713 RepID=UPI0031722FC2